MLRLGLWLSAGPCSAIPEPDKGGAGTLEVRAARSEFSAKIFLIDASF